MTTLQAYINSLTDDRKDVISRLRQSINGNISKGFEECMNYGMIGWVVPHSIFPDGYHCDPKQPLPFINLASQKRHVAVYHMGIYADESLMNWFLEEYPKHMSTKINMGKSCIRFTNMKKIPYALIGELATKMTPKDWIRIYESVIKK